MNYHSEKSYKKNSRLSNIIILYNVGFSPKVWSSKFGGQTTYQKIVCGSIKWPENSISKHTMQPRLSIST